MRRRRLRHDREYPHGGLSARGPVSSRGGRPGRAHDRLALDPGAAPRSHGPRSDARAGGGRAPRRRPGRRRRLRSEERLRRRGDARHLARAPPREARALDRVAQREHDRAGARARAAARDEARRHARREAPRLPLGHRPGRRRLPDGRRLPPEPDGAAGQRRLRDPAHRGRGEVGRHEHDADDDLPRRGATRGGAGDRAHDRPLRGGDRDGPGGGAAQELHPEGCVPVPDRLGSDVRLGRLRGGARPRAALRRVRRAARGAGSPPRGMGRRSSSGSA